MVKMIKGYKLIKEKVLEWKLSERRVQILSFECRIAGTAKLGTEWVIPINAKHSRDSRVTSGKYQNRRKDKSLDKSECMFYNCRMGGN